MPTPPKESMGGGKKTIQQENSFNFHKVQFEYIENQEAFIGSPEYQLKTQAEKNEIDLELASQNSSYELLRKRVEDF